MTDRPYIFRATASDDLKSVSLNAFDAELYWGKPNDGDLDEHAAYQKVAWVRRCVELRANALSSIPIRIVRQGSTDEAEWEFANTLPALLWMASAGLQVYGASYWIRERNRWQIDRGYRWLSPVTMRPKIDAVKGLTGFTRTISGRAPIDLGIDDVVYVWSPSLGAEVGPGTGWVKTALAAAGLVWNIDQYGEAFFKRGAIAATVLSVEGMPPEQELDKLQSWWKRLVGGNKKAFETVAVRASVKPIPLSFPTSELAMTELMQNAREQIATAAGVPQTMLEDAANYACLPGDQLVWTPHGPKPIASMRRGDSIWQMTATGIETNVVEAIIPQGPAPVYQIRTPHRTLRASDNHPLLTVAVVPGRGPYAPQRASLVWKRADQIRPGDLLVSAEECPDQQRIEVDGYPLTEEFMELAGLYLGDGDGDDRTGVRFAIPEGPLQDYYAATAERVAQPSTTMGGTGQGRDRSYGPVHSRKRHYIFTVGSKRFYRRLKALGLTGNARTKRIPAWVYEAALPLRLAFLRGYLDADGTVGKDGRLVFGSCNLALIHDVRALLVSCGIPVSNVLSDTGRVGNYGPIELHRFICGYPAYNRLVGSHDERYLKRLEHESNGRRDGRYVPGVTAAAWNLHLPSGLGIERVAAVESIGEQEVYDLCTTGSHTFIAEGLVVHNTASEHHRAFYEETVIPQAIVIRDAFNAQIFNPQGLELALDWQELDIFQEDENKRSQSLRQLTSAGVPLPMAMELLGFDLPNGMTYDQLRAELENERARKVAEQQELMRQGAGAAAGEPQRGAQRAAPEQATRAMRDELDRWRRKALSALKAGDTPDVAFETELIDEDDQKVLHEALAAANDAEGVRAAFDRWPFRAHDDEDDTPYP